MSIEEKRLIHYQRTYKEIDGQLYKRCSIHNEYFPKEDEWFPCNDEYFYKHNSSSDGLFPYCKRCNSRKTVKYQKDNKEWHNNYSNEYIKNDYVKERRRKYDQEKRYDKSKKDWQKNHPEKIREYRLNREQNKKHTIYKKEWEACKKYFDSCCAYCGLPLEKHLNIFAGELKLTDFHKEHVKHDGENDLSNCVPSCKSCNSSKRTYELEEWYIKQKFYSKDRLNKIHKWLDKDYKLYIKEHKPRKTYNRKDTIHIENSTQLDL